MTATEILTAVKARTGRSELVAADVSDPIYAILVDATARHAFLKSTATQSWVSGTRSYAFPTGATRILHITLPDAKPLAKIPFSQYLSYAVSDNDTGEPTEFALDNSLIYPYTIPGATYSATIYYQYTHPSALTTILLDDRFKEMVISGVCFKVFANLGIGDTEGGLWYQAYENQLSVMANKIMDENINVCEGYY